jgi:LytR cell envelope-related transcriptional attenuator
VAIVALLAVAAAVVLFAATSIGGSSPHASSPQTTNAPAAGQPRGAASFKPSSITVAVLNGTAVNQLAHRIGDKLAARGYRKGTIATGTDQTETKTTVAYRPGAKNRAAALHVARALGLPRSAVKPVDQSTLQVACPGPSTCTANVVVTVGADLSTS